MNDREMIALEFLAMLNHILELKDPLGKTHYFNIEQISCISEGKEPEQCEIYVGSNNDFWLIAESAESVIEKIACLAVELEKVN